MTGVRIVGAIAMAALAAGCSSTPSYYTQRVSAAPASGYAAASATTEDPAEAQPQARRGPRRHAATTQAPRKTPAPHAEATAAADAPVRENTGAADLSAAEVRAENERRARIAHERRERALRRSIDSICRGC